LGDINSSEYSQRILSVAESKVPYFNMQEEIKLQQVVSRLIKGKVLQSAHDVSEGGIFATCLEGGMPRELGFEIETDPNLRADRHLFGEGQSRVVVTIKPDRASELKDILTAENIPFIVLGTVTEGPIRVNMLDFGDICDWKTEYDTALENYLEK
jgi:phosphoribosylformylglycinamidine synthase